jgi:hypothetical protein
MAKIVAASPRATQAFDGTTGTLALMIAIVST